MTLLNHFLEKNTDIWVPEVIDSLKGKFFKNGELV
jgi:hypothetical protein